MIQKYIFCLTPGPSSQEERGSSLLHTVEKGWG